MCLVIVSGIQIPPVIIRNVFFQNSLEQSRGTSFFRRKRDKSAHHRRSKSLGKVNKKRNSLEQTNLRRFRVMHRIDAVNSMSNIFFEMQYNSIIFFFRIELN